MDLGVNLFKFTTDLLILEGLSQFRDKNGRFPSPTSKEDAAAVADLCAALLEDASPEQST